MKSLNKQTPDSGPEIIANSTTSVCSAQLDLISTLLGSVVPVLSTWSSRALKEMLASTLPREGITLKPLHALIFLDMSCTDRLNLHDHSVAFEKLPTPTPVINHSNHSVVSLVTMSTPQGNTCDIFHSLVQ